MVVLLYVTIKQWYNYLLVGFAVFSDVAQNVKTAEYKGVGVW